MGGGGELGRVVEDQRLVGRCDARGPEAHRARKGQAPGAAETPLERARARGRAWPRGPPPEPRAGREAGIGAGREAAIGADAVEDHPR
jgi:hypothetical protein